MRPIVLQTPSTPEIAATDVTNVSSSEPGPAGDATLLTTTYDYQSLPGANLIISAPLPVTGNISHELGLPGGKEYVIEKGVGHRMTCQARFYQVR